MVPPKKKGAKKAEQTDPTTALIKNALVWSVIVLLVTGIIWLAMIAPKQKTLECGNTGVPSSLIGFGTCRTE